MPMSFFGDEGGSGGDGSGSGDGDAGAGGDGGDGGDGDQGGDAGAGAATTTKWYDGLPDEVKANATVQKYGSLEEQVKGHLELQKAFGMDKIVWPKDENDHEAWAKLHDKLGVPREVSGYKLSEANLPEELKGVSIDKDTFIAAMHQAKVPQKSAELLFKSYVNTLTESYDKQVAKHNAKFQEDTVALQKEWGEAFEEKKQISNRAVRYLAENEEEIKFLTNTLGGDPKGMRVLARLGETLKENQIGSFEATRFNLTPDEATQKLTKIRRSKAYLDGVDEDGQALSKKDHEALIDEANRLQAIIVKSQQQ